MIIKLINYIYDYSIANRQSPIANRQSPINIILNFVKYFSQNKNLFIYAYTLNYILSLFLQSQIFIELSIFI